MYDVLIIGGGPAGMTAGLYAARMGLNVAMVERMLAGGQAATTNIVENYPGFPDGIGGPELMYAFQQQAEKAGMKIEYANLDRLELTGDVKRAIAGESVYSGRAMILCMGAQPRALNVPGEERYRGLGVSYCATCDGAFYRGKRVAVAGGGNTAVEDALYLSALAEKVYLIHRRDSLRADASLRERIEQHSNIEIIWNSIITEITGGQTLTSLTLQNKLTSEHTVLPVDGVFVAIGQIPETALVAGGLALTADGYIAAGESTLTDIPGVFAAGDIRKKPLRQVVTAASDGAVAAAAAGRYLESM